jgi:hypothetical protein
VLKGIFGRKKEGVTRNNRKMQGVAFFYLFARSGDDIVVDGKRSLY